MIPGRDQTTKSYLTFDTGHPGLTARTPIDRRELGGHRQARPGEPVTAAKPAAGCCPGYDHRAIVEVYERADVDEAMRVIARHDETAKETIRRAIAAAGGRL
jgi:hypothetical protein